MILPILASSPSVWPVSRDLISGIGLSFWFPSSYALCLNLREAEPIASTLAICLILASSHAFSMSSSSWTSSTVTLSSLLSTTTASTQVLFMFVISYSFLFIFIVFRDASATPFFLSTIGDASATPLLPLPTIVSLLVDSFSFLLNLTPSSPISDLFTPYIAARLKLFLGSEGVFDSPSLPCLQFCFAFLFSPTNCFSSLV